jgi:hypothetical protein
MLAERRNATEAAPLLSQPPPVTDYDPAEDDALSTLIQASLCLIKSSLFLFLCRCTPCWLVAGFGATAPPLSAVAVQASIAWQTLRWVAQPLGVGRSILGVLKKELIR